MSNGKLPWSKFFWGDWARDAQLLKCSIKTQGAWMRLLCAMHDQGSAEVQGTPLELSRIIGCGITPEETLEAVEELKRTGAAEVRFKGPHDMSGSVRIMSRRLSRECHVQEQWRKWQRDHRLRKQSGKCQANVRPASGVSQPVDSDPDPDPENTVVNESSNLLKKETTDSNTKQEKSTSLTAVFEFWKSALNHPRAILDAKRRRLVTARLAEGFTVEQLQAAITGCSRSAFHQGSNDSGAVYDDLALICRDAAHVEKFITQGETDNGRQKFAQLSKNSQRLLRSFDAYADSADRGNDSGGARYPGLTVLRRD
jgi:transposase-like protein